jgi:hypothetical protein
MGSLVRTWLMSTLSKLLNGWVKFWRWMTMILLVLYANLFYVFRLNWILLNLLFQGFTFLGLGVILCGLVSVMNVLATTACCVGSLDTRKSNAPNPLTGLTQISTIFPCRLSLWLGCVRILLHHGKTRTRESLWWVLLNPTRMLTRALPMELS